MTTLTIGDRAPKFNLECSDGTTSSLADFKGRRLVLYFYPKDDTPGCTTQAIAFSGAQAAIEAAGAEILGVSADPLTKHGKFIEKHKLSIRLGSDPEHQMLTAYGVWVEKSMYGRSYMGIERTTFIIDEAGKISHMWRKVKVKNHVEEVLAALHG